MLNKWQMAACISSYYSSDKRIQLNVLQTNNNNKTTTKGWSPIKYLRGFLFHSFPLLHSFAEQQTTITNEFKVSAVSVSYIKFSIAQNSTMTMIKCCLRSKLRINSFIFRKDQQIFIQIKCSVKVHCFTKTVSAYW